jgi:hypothetical protein
MSFPPTYRINVRPLHPYTPRLGLRSLTAERIAERLGDGVVWPVIENGYLDLMILVDMTRESHEAALAKLLVAIQIEGWDIVNATITQWTDRLVEGAIAGGATGGGIGMTTKSDGMTLLGLAIGGVAGAICGSTLRKAERVVVVKRTPFGWEFQELQLADAPAFVLAHA